MPNYIGVLVLINSHKRGRLGRNNDVINNFIQPANML